MTDPEILYVFYEKGASKMRREELEAYRKKYKPTTNWDQHVWDMAYYVVENQGKEEEAREDVTTAKQWWITLTDAQRVEYERFVHGTNQTKLVKTEVKTVGWQAQVGGWFAVLSIVFVIYFVFLKWPGKWL